MFFRTIYTHRQTNRQRERIYKTAFHALMTQKNIVHCSKRGNYIWLYMIVDNPFRHFSWCAAVFFDNIFCCSQTLLCLYCISKCACKGNQERECLRWQPCPHVMGFTSGICKSSKYLSALKETTGLSSKTLFSGIMGIFAPCIIPHSFWISC